MYLEERSRATRRTRSMNEFCEFANEHDLIDIPIVGAQFTWSNSQARPSLSRLDRFLISTDCEDIFNPVLAHALPRVGFDHIPIFLKGGVVGSYAGPRPFKFQNMWLQHPGFKELVKGWWENCDVAGPPGQRF